MTLDAATATAIGPRTENQDRALLIPEAGLIAVADGMGGEADGARCAEVAVAAVRQARRDCGDPAVLVRRAHEAVRAALYGRGYGGCALVVAQIQPGWAHVAWLGDSVAVLAGAAGARLLTWPQNVPGCLFQKGQIGEEEYRIHESRSMLLAHCGMDARIELPVETTVIPLTARDVLVLCTDGAFDPLGTARIGRVVQDAARHARSTALTARALLTAAARAQLTDNATIAVARIT